MMVGSIGSPSYPQKGYRPVNVIVAQPRKASQKPDEQYCVAAYLDNNGYKIEIFARYDNRRDGIVSIGNQV